MTQDALYIRPAAVHEKHEVHCLFGRTVTTIDRAAKTVTLGTGETLHYTKLALTTGGYARQLPLAGADRPNVHYVRRIDDIEKLQAGFKEGKRLVVIGGGDIGLEAASVGIKKGLKFTVVEASPRGPLGILRSGAPASA